MIFCWEQEQLIRKCSSVLLLRCLYCVSLVWRHKADKTIIICHTCPTVINIYCSKSRCVKIFCVCSSKWESMCISWYEWGSQNHNISLLNMFLVSFLTVVASWSPTYTNPTNGQEQITSGIWGTILQLWEICIFCLTFPDFGFLLFNLTNGQRESNRFGNFRFDDRAHHKKTERVLRRQEKTRWLDEIMAVIWQRADRCAESPA